MYDLIVGLSGLAGSGKTTACKALQKEFDCDYFHMVDPLKDMCRYFFRLSDDQVNGTGKDEVDERFNQTPRKILIDVGMYFRDIDPDVWMLATLKRVAGKPNKGKIALLDAVRFENEIDAIHDWSGKIIRIQKNGQEAVSCRTESDQLDIPKEKFDVIVKAELGDMDGLGAQVVQQVTQWLKD